MQNPGTGPPFSQRTGGGENPMAAYLRFYEFDNSPFESDAAKRSMVLGTQSLRGAFGDVKQGLEDDSPRICLSGPGGVGKTSFCRALPKLLSDTARVALIQNPRKSWQEIRATIAKKFELEGGAISRKALLKAGSDGKQLVLVIDQAESLSHEALDHLDILLQYKRDDDKQLLHCIMLADLEAASSGTEIPLLWWLDKLTTLQLQFSPIPVQGLRHYVEKHLAKAGWAGGELFTHEALVSIHRNTGGVPRAINELCERILIEGGAREITSITPAVIEQLCGDNFADEPTLSPELSADFSFGDFGTSPTAQEMLDNKDHLKRESEARAEADREAFAPITQDLVSLIETQDSPEPLRMAPEVPANEENSLSLELADTPHAEEDDPSYQMPSSRPRTGISRPPSASRARKSPVRSIVGLAAVLLVAVGINSQLPAPSEMIQNAEVRIAKAFNQKPAKQSVTLAADQIEINEDVADQELADLVQSVDAKEGSSSLPPSLLDRADQIAAETGLDLIPLPELDTTLNGDAPAKIAVDVTADTKPSELARALDMKASDRLPTAGAATKMPSQVVTVATPNPQPTTQSSRGKTAGTKPPKSPSQAKASEQFSSDLMVVNEYTAIPQAAESAPKLPTPTTQKATSEPRTTSKSAKKTADRKPATQEVAPAEKSQPQAVPAKLAPRKPNPTTSAATATPVKPAAIAKTQEAPAAAVQPVAKVAPAPETLVDETAHAAETKVEPLVIETEATDSGLKSEPSPREAP
ncbi:MAG: general secretion pathway protein A [Myxococcota bacterium]|jgi:general secretion pathway protein A